MSGTLNFWTTDSKSLFHDKVVDLFEWNREPCAAEDYRSQPRDWESGPYMLSFGQEIHIADHIAFLAQSEEGARTVSAVAIEEHESSWLVVRLAGNQTPSPQVLRGLEVILKTVQEYAMKGKQREIYCEDLFDKVVSFSSKRLHERLRSKTSPHPWWITEANRAQPSLYLRVRKLVQTLLRSRHRSQSLANLCSDLGELASSYEQLDGSYKEEDEQELLKSAVRKSFAISTSGGKKSLEEHLKDLQFATAACQREVLEIDKIGRYFGLCKDLIRFSRRPAISALFRNIKLELCEAPYSIQLPSAAKPCHVHGEVQLILYYEQYPHDPPPRAIGSSKSACFLCDLFIKQHGHYHVSHSHKRLYDKWTIPDVHWMTDQQAAQFQAIIQAMTDEMARLRRTCRKQEMGKFNGFESRAHLIFPEYLITAESTPSEVSRVAELRDDPQELSNTADMAHIGLETVADLGSIGLLESDRETIVAVDATSAVSVASNDLPYSQSISLPTPSLHLQIEKLSVTFDFVEVSSGTLSISKTEDIPSRRRDHYVVNIADLPTDTETPFHCSTNSSELSLLLRNNRREFISISFKWHR